MTPETVRRTSRGRLVTEGPPDSGEPVRCTQAALEALGVAGWSPAYGMGMLILLEDEGGYHAQLAEAEVTLAAFCRAHPAGRYYLFTARGRGHAMALVDGVLTDTCRVGGRTLVYAVRLERAEVLREAT